MRGRPKKSPNYFKEGLYFIDEDQFYLSHNGDKWNSVGDYCFVKPLDIENSYLYEEGLEDNTGFLVYSNNTLLDLGVNEGDKVKVAEEEIIKPDPEDELAADRLKNAAATKKLAIFDAFEILNRIENERNMLDNPEEEKKNLTGGFAERRSK